MALEIDIPEDILAQLEQQWDNLPRRALEALAAEGFRSGILTSAQIQELLGFKSRWDTDAFLKNHGCYFDYDEQDLKHDIVAIWKIVEK